MTTIYGYGGGRANSFRGGLSEMEGNTDEEKLANYKLFLENQRKEREGYEIEQAETRKRWATEVEASRVYKNWEPLVREEMERVGDSWDSIESIVPSLEVLTTPYTESSWMPVDVAFTLWTKDRVYFPAWLGEYDYGHEVVISAPRYPNGEAMAIFGEGVSRD